MNLPPELRSIKVIPTFSCARGCFYCYNTLLQQTAVEMPTLLEQRLRKLLDHVTAPVAVELIGGEALEPRVVNRSVRLLRIARDSQSCSRVVVNTAITAERVLRDVAPLVDFIYLSVDASPHRSNRKRVPPTRLRSVASLVRSCGAQVGVSVTLFGDEDATTIIDFIRVLMDCGLDSIGFAHVSSTPFTAAEVERCAEQYHLLFKLRLALRGECSITGAVLESLEIHLSGARRRSTCECAIESIVLEPDGHVTYGTCRDETDRHLTPEMIRTVKREREIDLRAAEPCSTCELWNVCYGGCVTEARRLGGDARGRAPVHCGIMRTLGGRIRRDLMTAGDVIRHD